MVTLKRMFARYGVKMFGKKSESGYPGSFHVGFLDWIRRELGVWGEKRCYLCCGAVKDWDSTRVDIQLTIDEEVRGRKGIRKQVRTYDTTANVICDARDTKLAAESFDWVMIDPPYSKQLAEELYGTEEYFSQLNDFVKEAYRLLKPPGFILTLAYHVPSLPDGCSGWGIYGIYQIPQTRYMSALTILQKDGENDLQGLGRWI